MGKKLSEMTLEELWQLFPIFLTEPNPSWRDWFCEEKRFLQTVFPEATEISHIGSTAIKGIWAKPIIDILVEFPREVSMRDVCAKAVESGYICMKSDDNRSQLNKGYTEQGFAERVFHLHLRYIGDCDEVYFRDYLNSHAEAAKEYETLKLQLSKVYKHNRDAYTDAKADFVREITRKAKAEKDNPLK